MSKNTYHFTKCLYVNGQEQKLHFAQVLSRWLSFLGNDLAKDSLVHIPYGLVSLESKAKKQNGNIVYTGGFMYHDAIKKSFEII